MNLVTDSWILVSDYSGDERTISPLEIPEASKDNPKLRLSNPNDEFRWTTLEFLIALFQTSVSPDKSLWQQWKNSFPDSDTIDSQMTHSEEVFNVEKFMQQSVSKDTKPIRRLPVHGVPENSENNHRDIFNDQPPESLCTGCFSMALYSKQSRRPSGNAWFPGSIRGNTGGVPDTLIDGKNLWERIWNNVIPERDFPMYRENLGDPEQTPFPWMEDFIPEGRFKEKTPEKGHPYEVLWATPLLIEAKFQEGRKVCDGCGQTINRFVQRYEQENGGVKYSGIWIHPLSPRTGVNDDNQVQYGTLNLYRTGHRFWRRLIFEEFDNKNDPHISRSSNIRFYPEKNKRFQMIVMGQSIFSRNNVAFFAEDQLPVYDEDILNSVEFQLLVNTLVDSTQSAIDYLKRALFRLDQGKLNDQGNWESRGADNYPPSDGMYRQVERQLWLDTKQPFFDILDEYVETELGGDVDGYLKDNWRDILLDHTIDQYNDHADGLDSSTRKKVVARDDLTGMIHSIDLSIRS